MRGQTQVTDPSHPPAKAPAAETALPPPKPLPKPRHDPWQDLLILVIVVMCTIIAIKLVVEFVQWNKLQTCISAGRNCAPRLTGPL
jgi:hypothetical protein